MGSTSKSLEYANITLKTVSTYTSSVGVQLTYSAKPGTYAYNHYGIALYINGSHMGNVYITHDGRNGYVEGATRLDSDYSGTVSKSYSKTIYFSVPSNARSTGGTVTAEAVPLSGGYDGRFHASLSLWVSTATISLPSFSSQHISYSVNESTEEITEHINISASSPKDHYSMELYNEANQKVKTISPSSNALNLSYNRVHAPGVAEGKSYSYKAKLVGGGVNIDGNTLSQVLPELNSNWYVLENGSFVQKKEVHVISGGAWKKVSNTSIVKNSEWQS